MEKTGHIADEHLAALSQVVADRMGLHFPRERWVDLERGIAAAAKAEQRHPDDYAQRLLAAPLNRETTEFLARFLTVGETYFFREKRSFEILAEQVLPELVHTCQKYERKLRIWSAGCCTGEEAYSLAILLDRLFPGWAEKHVSILATDMNPSFLEKAARGVFSSWSFRNAPPWLQSGYFKEIDSRNFEIGPRIRERVTFARHNLAEDTYPSMTTGTHALDLILCRNVMMYFSPKKTSEAVRSFHRCLVEGGHLLVSATEISSQLFSQFTSLPFGEAVFYRKDKKPFAAPLSPPAESVLSAPPIMTVPALLLPVIVPAEVLEMPKIEKQSPYQAALALFEQGNYGAAAEKLEADSALTGSAEKSALMARICANLGRLSEARAWVEKALGADKLDPGLHYLHALILQEQGAPDEATMALKRALYLNPKLVVAHFALGNLAAREGKPEEADRCFGNVLSLLSDYPLRAVLPHSDGLAASRLREMVESAMALEARAS